MIILDFTALVCHHSMGIGVDSDDGLSYVETEPILVLICIPIGCDESALPE